MRAVVKLGGALFSRDPDVTALKEMGKVLGGFVGEGNQLVLVAGGGENARTYISAARKLGAKVEAPSSFHRRLPGARRTSIGERGLSAAEVADWEAYFQQPPDHGKKPGKPGSRG